MKLKLIVILGFCFFIIYITGIVPARFSLYYTVLALILSGLFIALPVSSDVRNNIVLLVAACTLSLTLIDLTCRVVLPEYLYYRPHERYIKRYTALPSLSRYKSNVRYEGESLGDLAAMSENGGIREKRKTLFVTDKFGFRNFPLHDSDSIDVIILGDSFGAGSGTSQDVIWPMKIQNKYNLTCYNLSLPGSPWHQLLNFKIEFPRLRIRSEPTLIWALFSGNDLDEEYKPEMNPHLEKSIIDRCLISFSTFRNRSPIRLILGRLLVKKSNLVLVREIDDESILFYKEYLESSGRSYSETISHENYENLVEVFNSMNSFCNDSGINVAVILIPTKSEVYNWIVNDEPIDYPEPEPSGLSIALSQLCSGLDFSYYDMKPDLIRASRQVYDETNELLWWNDDTHWNETGHDLAADLIYVNCLKVDTEVYSE